MTSGVSLDIEHINNPWLYRYFNMLHQRGLGKEIPTHSDSITNNWPSLNPEDLLGLQRFLTAVEKKLSAGEDSTLNQVIKELNRVMPEIVPTTGTTAILHAKRANEEEDLKAANQKRRRVMAADLFGIKEEDNGYFISFQMLILIWHVF